MLIFLLYLSLLLNIIYIIFRYKRSVQYEKQLGFFLNPVLYLFIFSTFYLIVSSIILDYIPPSIFGVNIKQENFNFTQSVCIISNIIIFIFYLFIKDAKINFLPVKIKNTIYIYYLSIIVLLISAYIAVILFIYWQELFNLRENRAIAYNYYVDFVDKPYKIDLILYLSIACCFFINILNTPKWLQALSFTPLILILGLEYSHGGRTISLKIILLLFFVFLFKKNILNKKINIYKWSTFFLLLLLVGFLQRKSNSNDILNTTDIAILFGEFINTRLTMNLIYPYMGEGSILEQLTFSFLGLLPSSIRDNLLDYSSTFDIIKNINNFDYGFASNITSDAIYFYGNFYILNILLICFILQISHRLLLTGNLVRLFYLIIITINIQGFFRSSFFDYFFVYIYITTVYLIFIWFPFYKKKIFTVNFK
ncbi:TPA: oligosaccharide repeat unit polymerase [Providencia rettgeri]|nr:oligosaccharide repeat unit polymerase [Providencia rettgeri]